MSDFIRSVTDQLKTYLAGQVSGLNVSTEWPVPGKEMALPALTIVTGEPKFQRCPPYLVAQGATQPNNTATTTYCIGTYELNLQLDLWTKYPIQRVTLYEQIFAALEPLAAQGLVLTLSGYYNQKSNYHYIGYRLLDNEESASRQEFRARFDVQVNCLAVRQTTDYIILETGLDFSTPETIEES